MTTKWNENDRVNFLDESRILQKLGIHGGISHGDETKIQKEAEIPRYFEAHLVEKNFAFIRFKKKKLFIKNQSRLMID